MILYIKPIGIFILAACAEIFGCFTFWLWLRSNQSVYWIMPGIASLIFFSWILTFSPAEFAGRSYAIYGGIYIISSLFWMWKVEKQAPDLWDLFGATLCFIGAIIILWAPKHP